MCGFTGIVFKNKKNKPNLMKKMTECLSHRGPDEYGEKIFDYCMLGHARLSIIDLSSGQQPMNSIVSGSTLVFNGEIYGYQEIKKQLLEYPFQNNSDSEVILALYDKYQTNMVSHLPGAFAFAIWDDKQQRLLLARDRFGEKPLFYAFTPDGDLIFASEIKSILASELITPILSKDSMAHMLLYFYVHPLKTIYENIHVLPPGHQLIYQHGKVTITPYWQMPAINEKMTESEATEGFAHYFTQAIKRTLISDVPVGVFLSGGLDSSTIAIEASKYIPNISTLSFGYKNSPLNELPYANAVAQMYHTDHHVLTDVRNDLADLFVLMTKLQDEPFGDTSQIPLYLLSQHASTLFKVVLDGSGADELLAGYPPHLSTYNAFQHTELKQHLKWGIINILNQVNSLFGINNSFISQKYETLKARKDLISNKNPLAFHLSQHGVVSSEIFQKLNIVSNEDFKGKQTFSPLGTPDDSLRSDVTRYMPGDILVKGDRITMANSLEIRLPFLEKDLAEFLLSMPIHLKTNGTIGKIPMRNVYNTQWPEELKNRPKQGFGIPVEQWYNRPDFQALKCDYLFNKNIKLYSYVDYNEVIKLSESPSTLIFNILFLAIWLEK